MEYKAAAHLCLNSSMSLVFIEKSFLECITSHQADRAERARVIFLITPPSKTLSIHTNHERPQGI